MSASGRSRSSRFLQWLSISAIVIAGAAYADASLAGDVPLCLRTVKNEPAVPGGAATDSIVVVVLYNEWSCRDCYRVIDSIMANERASGGGPAMIALAAYRSSALARRQTHSMLSRLMPGTMGIYFWCGLEDRSAGDTLLERCMSDRGAIVRTPAVLLIDRLHHERRGFLPYDALFGAGNQRTPREVLLDALDNFRRSGPVIVAGTKAGL